MEISISNDYFVVVCYSIVWCGTVWYGIWCTTLNGYINHYIFATTQMYFRNLQNPVICFRVFLKYHNSIKCSHTIHITYTNACAGVP